MKFIFIFVFVLIMITLTLGFNVNLFFGKHIANKTLYWISIFVITQSYTIYSVVNKISNIKFPYYIDYAVCSIFAITILSFIVFIFIDITLLFLKFTPLLRGIYIDLMTAPYKIGVFSIFTILSLLLFGLYSANSTKIVYYTVKSNKLPINSSFRIVQLSDLHVNSFFSKKNFLKSVSKINSLNPDLVFFLGDIIDFELEPFVSMSMGDALKQIKTSFGVYGILGNHEYYSRELSQVIDEYRKHFNLLYDESITINLSGFDVNIVGRADYVSKDFNLNRQSLENLSKRIDPNNFTVVLDHQPRDVNIREAVMSNFDMMLSGHTHHGQIFPANLITSIIYQNSYGLKVIDSLSVIVTSGYGTWGPPIRLGSYSEIVVIDVIGG